MCKIYKGLNGIKFEITFNLASDINTRGHAAEIVLTRYHIDIRKYLFYALVISK